MPKKPTIPENELFESLQSMVSDFDEAQVLDAVERLRSELAKRRAESEAGVIITNESSVVLRIEHDIDARSLKPGKSCTVTPESVQPQEGGDEDLPPPASAPVYPARLLCFDVVKKDKNDVEITLDVTAIDPERMNGMTILAKPLGGNRELRLPL